MEINHFEGSGLERLTLFSFLPLFFRFLSCYSLFSISWFSSSQSYPLPHSCRYPCTQQGLLFIVSAVTEFYYFSP